MISLAPIAVPPNWQLTCERTHFAQTGRYAEAVEFCRRLDRASADAKVLQFGTSPEGRPMVALLISTEGAFTPDRVRRSKRPFLIVNNGIHSGEIEGKDASLMLARDILLSRSQAALAQGANLLIIPVFSCDAHERFGPYNRINQNGPREMGWRATATNLNLNRDFIKADGGEMRAMLRLLHRWKPDFFFDNHTTDGADFQYVVQLQVPVAQSQDPRIALWSRRMWSQVARQVERDGFLNAPYFDLADRGDPGKGISIGDFGPRYSTGYLAAMNRPAMLVETHVLKPYEPRVRATYSVVRRTIEACIRHAAALKQAIRDADARAAATRPGDKIVLTADLAATRRPFVFKALPYTPIESPVSGSKIAAWGTAPIDIPTTIRDSYVPSLTIGAPAGYAIPPQWTDAIGRLSLHGLQTFRTKRSVSDSFESVRFENVKFPAAPFESRFSPSFEAYKVVEKRTLIPGTVVVPIAQPGAKLAMHLLEPQAPDSLLQWGFFNAIFEQKEYGEDYAIEPVARRMLERDPALRAEFERRLKEDPRFAASPQARLQFFYRRSPYWDERLNKYPVVRLDAHQLAALRAAAR